MKKLSTCLAIAYAAAISLMIAGCGGGGSLTDIQSGANASASVTTVSGVAAAGAPIVGNAFLKDSSIPPMVKMATIDTDGTFAFEVKGLQAPFILRAEGISAGSPQALHSFADGTGTANINPLSNAAVASAAGVSDPATIYMNPVPAMLQKIAANIPAAIAAFQAKLKPLMDRFGASANPVYDSFAADHTGLDALFDAVKITVAGGNVVVSNRGTSAVILNAPLNGISSATFNMANMPSASVSTPVQAQTSPLYDTNCAGCHGPLATSSKRGATVARIQAAIAGNVGGMGRFSTLSAADIQSIANALAGTTTPAIAPVTIPTTDGATLYGTHCVSCHGPLATSSKLGRTATQIQAAINANTGGMGSLSTLSATQVQAIAGALVTSTPAPSGACGSCHAIPPATGHHSTRMGATCATCHGSGYSNTAVNAATHNNGVVNVVSTIGWNPTTRTCSNSCHGTERW